MKAMVEIHNKRPTILGLQNGVRLAPGKNKVSAEEYEQNKNLETFKAWCKLGWIRVKVVAKPDRFAAPEAPAEADALSELNAGQAKALVASTDNIELLDTWYSSESRVTVQKAIKGRLAELVPEEETEPFESEEENEDEDFEDFDDEILE